MGRSPCCDKVGLKKGPWTPEEDQKLLAYIEEHGHGSWRALPTKAGLQRCGKSCRLRWTNYLRPDIKRGKFSIQEEQTIIQLHALLGNRWSAIATHLPKRTDNEIKNYWNTHLKKRLAKMGIDPVTHKPKSDALILSNDGHNKHAANLSHMAQWESARLEAEARLVRQSKLRSNSIHQNPLHSPDFISSPPPPPPPPLPGCLDILKAWNGVWTSTSSTSSSTIKPNIINDQSAAIAGGTTHIGGGGGGDLESPTSTLSYSENAPQLSSSGINTTTTNNNNGENSISTAFIEFVGNNSSGNSCEGTGGGGIIMKEEGGHEEDWKGYGSSNTNINNLVDHHPGGINIINIENNSMSSSLISSAAGAVGHHHNHHDLTGHVVPMDTSDDDDDDDDDDDVDEHVPFVERFTDLLLSSTTSATGTTNSEGCSDSSDNNNVNAAVTTTEYLEDNKNYWNSILNLVNSSSPSDSAMF